MASSQCTGGAALRATITGGGKRRRKHSMVVPKSTFTSYIDEGLMHLKKMSHRKAKLCFNHALELKDDDPLALISRSQCNMNLGLHQEALKDAERTFKVDKNFTPGLYQFGEVLFSLGFFEKALIFYHQGRRLRKNAVEFVSGIVKSENAIKTAILDQAATQIEDIDEILPLIDEIENEDSLVKHQCCIRPIEAETLLEKRKPLLPPKNKMRERWVTREILRDLAHHKFFVSSILNKLSDPRMQVGESTKVKDNVAEILFFIEHHERLLRYMNPMYHRKYGLNFNKTKVNQYEQQILEDQHNNKKLMRDAAEGAVLKTVVQIEHSLSKARYSDAQLGAERCIRQIKKMSTNLIPRKFEFIMDLTHYRGVSLMRQRMYGDAVDAFKNEFKLGQKYNKGSILSRSLDFMARCHALKGNFNEAVESWEARLEFAKTSLEKAYTFHEIGRSLLELGKKELSRYYALESLSIANENDNYVWATYARILLGQIEIKGSNYQEAMEQFEAAKEAAVKQPNGQAISKMLKEITHFLKVLIEHKLSEDQETDGNDDDDETQDSMLNLIATPEEILPLPLPDAVAAPAPEKEIN